MTSYAELAVTTNFSFLHGASHPWEFVEQASALGYSAIGITDRNSLAGVVRAYEQWTKEEAATRPRLLVGARLVFRDGTPDILAYPRDRKAYGRLSRLISTGKLRAPPGKSRATKGECLLDFADLLACRHGLLLIVVPPPSQLGFAMQTPRCATSPRSSLRSRGEEAGECGMSPGGMPGSGFLDFEPFRGCAGRNRHRLAP
jgi:error-prone DNA polymerase